MNVKHLYKIYRQQNPFVRLFVNAVALIVLWLLFFNALRNLAWVQAAYTYGTELLTNSLLHISQQLLSLMGFDSYIFADQKTLQVHGTRGVRLDLGCLGRNLMGMFAGFIIAFPGNVKSKLWYIPMGLLVVMFVNVLRICGLSLSLLYWPEGYFRYHHHTLFQYMVHALTFLLWYVWIRKYGHTQSKV